MQKYFSYLHTVQEILEDKIINEFKFNQLLKWLDNDPQKSAKKYHDFQKRLILYFSARGCAEAEDLADITIDRVMEKIAAEPLDFEGNKMKYFYAFARNIHHEYLRERNLQLNEEILEDVNSDTKAINDEEVSKTAGYLKDCLGKLKSKDKKLILSYYNAKTGREKEYREKIAKRYKISTNSLRVKIFRLKNNIEKCVEKHLKS